MIAGTLPEPIQIEAVTIERKEVKELREKMGMNRREFSDYYGIPYRTVQDWEAEKRELPDYLLRLLKYRAEIECRIERTGK